MRMLVWPGKGSFTDLAVIHGPGRCSVQLYQRMPMVGMVADGWLVYILDKLEMLDPGLNAIDVFDG